jgi:hypothetical protein
MNEDLARQWRELVKTLGNHAEPIPSDDLATAWLEACRAFAEHFDAECFANGWTFHYGGWTFSVKPEKKPKKEDQP